MFIVKYRQLVCEAQGTLLEIIDDFRKMMQLD